MFSSSPAPGAENSVAPAPAGRLFLVKVPQDGSVGGLQALGARDRHPGHAEAPAALARVPGAEGQEKQQLLADIVTVSGEDAVCDAREPAACCGIGRRKAEVEPGAGCVPWGSGTPGGSLFPERRRRAGRRLTLHPSSGLRCRAAGQVEQARSASARRSEK